MNQSAVCRRAAAVVSLLALAVACDDDNRPKPDPEPVVCQLGGDYLIGPPQLLDGACSRLPRERSLTVRPVLGERAYELVFAGAVMAGRADEACILTLDDTPTVLDGVSTVLGGQVGGDGERLDVVLTQKMSGLPANEQCDARYALTGQRVDLDELGNSLGGRCGTGAVCASALCAFGGVVACQFDTCVYQRNAFGEESVYCTEPCEPGSCPEGYDCINFAPSVFRASDSYYCALKEPVCGDGEVEGYERCDDGNLTDGDGCAADCGSDESCGNGVIDAIRAEECDDDEAFDGDGCSARCKLEECGNSVVDPGETCDQGDDVAGDGCGVDCQLEACGNGVIDPAEACDDGNGIATDGCDGTCRVGFVRGLAAIDAGQGAENARVGNVLSALDGGRVALVWNEEFAGTSPFGAAREVRSAGAALDEPALFAGNTRYHANLRGLSVEGLARLSSGVIVLLLRDDVQLFLSRSMNGGATFSDPTAIAIAGLPAYSASGSFAQLHTDGVHLYMLAALNVLVASVNRNLYFTRSSDAGTHWSDAVRLSPQPDFRGWASRPHLLGISSGELVVAWGDGAVNGGSVYAARSLTHGATWVRLNENLGAHAAGRRDETLVALDNSQGFIHVAWAGPAGLRVARWSRDSSPWRITTVARASDLQPSVGPVSLARGSGDDMHLAFASGRSLFVARSRDVGATFEAPRRVGRLPEGEGAGDLRALSLTVDRTAGVSSADGVSLAWVDDDGEVTRPWHIDSADGGTTWAKRAVAMGRSGASALRTSEHVVRVGGARPLSLFTSDRQLWIVDGGSAPAGVPDVLGPGSLGEGCALALTDGGWCRPSADDSPAARSFAAAVSIPGAVVMYGGHDGFQARADGGVYDLASDTWERFDLGEAGAWGRYGHSMLWTGTELLVWGGTNGEGALGDGIAFTPGSGSWRTLATLGAPTPRHHHTAVWTGAEMIVFGGEGADGPRADGARYRPSTDAWLPMPAAQVAVTEHTAVWTGTRMLVFGGRGSDGTFRSSGFSYDPAAPSGSAIQNLTTSNAPSPRARHTATWTGDAMLVWGGRDSTGPLGTGAIYRPTTQAWTAMGASGAPSARSGHVAVLAGGLWLVWGGTSDASGALFDVGTSSWFALDTTRAPEPRAGAVGVWTGDRVVVLGGQDGDGAPLREGGVFVP